MDFRALVLVLLPALAACALEEHLKPYHMEIQQGNYITQEMIAQLKPGMTKEQVRYVLGTPLVSDIFHVDRWDYVFMREPANSTQVEYRRISVFFEDGKLARIEGDVVPMAEKFENKSDAARGVPTARNGETAGKPQR